MNIELVRVLFLFGYSAIALASYLACCFWDLRPDSKLTWTGCLVRGAFWPLAIMFAIAWMMLVALERIHRKISHRD